MRKFNWDELNAKIKNTEDKQDYTDPIKENLFTPKLQNGKYEAIIRFLPRPENDTSQIPFVKLINHVFKTSTGQWVYENCPTLFKQDCPICKYNSDQWIDGDKMNNDEIRKRTRRTNYYSNILVIKDPQNPENEGKVFIYKYGTKIFDKIYSKISPEEGSIDDPVKVFDYFNGQNFKLKITQTKSGNNVYPTYTQSEFTGTCSPVYNDDSKIEELDKKLHMLGDIDSKDKFKSYEELEKLFNQKMGFDKVKPKSIESNLINTNESNDDIGEIGEIDIGNDDEFFNELEND